MTTDKHPWMERIAAALPWLDQAAAEQAAIFLQQQAVIAELEEALARIVEGDNSEQAFLQAQAALARARGEA